MKVVTYNINKAKGWSFFQNNIKKLEEFIKDSDADIVILQEVVGLNSKRKILSTQLEEIADNTWKDFKYERNSVYKHGHHGNAILSKFPIESYFQKNISTNKFEQRGVLYTKIRHSSDEILHLYNIHLDLTERGRKKQAQSLLKLINSHNKGDKVIMAGDFNDWKTSIGDIFEKEGMKEVGKVTNGVNYKTFPSFFPILSLDRIYYKNLNLISSNPLNGNKLSDHLPVFCEFSL